MFLSLELPNSFEKDSKNFPDLYNKQALAEFSYHLLLRNIGLYETYL
jgi:hypothetical protein